MELSTTKTGKKNKREVIHHGTVITAWVKHIDKRFLFWTLTIGIGEFLVSAWPATALGVFGADAMLNFVLFVYAIRGLLLIYAALSAESIHFMHGMEGVRNSPFRVYGSFRESNALMIWWVLAYIIGGLFGLVLLIVVASTYTWWGCKLLYWLSVGFYTGTTIESFIIPTFLYSKAIDDNVKFYMKKAKEDKSIKSRSKSKKKEQVMESIYTYVMDV